MSDSNLETTAGGSLGSADASARPISSGRAPDDVTYASRLYVLDCGKITQVGAKEFGFTDGELATEMFTPCFLIVHPQGALLWDTGEIPDSELEADGSPTQMRSFVVTRPLLPQLAEIGYTPSNIRYLAMSHYHNDHVANANSFAGSTWIVQRPERDAMFAKTMDVARNGPIAPSSRFYDALMTSETIILDGADHDVFGDGAVVIKFTPGHTAGHQSLFVRLKETGPVLLSGDLYHHTKELNRAASFVNHASNNLTSQSRAAIEAFARQENADIWIQHDAAQGADLKKAPAYYD